MDLTYEEKAFFDVLTADPKVIAMVEDVMEQVTFSVWLDYRKDNFHINKYIY